MDDDDYGSDEFDSLPPGTLYELEQNAFQATQATTSQHFSVPPINSNSVLRTHAAPSHHTGSLRPPPRLHTGLTNDYNTLEVGELEAEVYDNVDGQHAVPYGHHAPAADIEWAVNGKMGDAMELDEGYEQVNMAEINARLAQVSPWNDSLSLERNLTAYTDGTRKRTDDTGASRGQRSSGHENRRNQHYSIKTNKDDPRL